MTTITAYFEQALLSSAAYADFEEGMDSAEYKNALIDSGRISDYQATEFITNWSVVEQSPDSASGFSGTVFERLGKGVRPLYRSYAHTLGGDQAVAGRHRNADWNDKRDQYSPMYKSMHQDTGLKPTQSLLPAARRRPAVRFCAWVIHHGIKGASQSFFFLAIIRSIESDSIDHVHQKLSMVCPLIIVINE